MVLKIGHRGACGYEPENTILSFKKAIELEVDFIELDVRLSKDGSLVVIHDETLDKTTDGQGKVSEKTIQEIRSYRTKKNQKVPSLQEVINFVKGKTKLNIEIKGVNPVKKVVEIIQKNKLEKDVIISSNHVQSLLIIKNRIPKTKTALIYYATKTVFREYLFAFFSLLFFPITKRIILSRAKSAKVDYIHLLYLLATKKFISQLHELGYKVNVWTVNDSKTVKKFLKKKVDGIITNYPDIL